MKKLILFLLLLAGLYGRTATAQGLRVDSLINFPQSPGDTIYSNQTYSGISILLHNGFTNVFSGSVAIFLSADSLLHIDTLRSDTTTIITLAPGADTTISADSNVIFEAVNYAAGDNIVVVWPSLRIAFPVDSFHVDIYFAIGAGLEEIAANQSVRLWPVPARQLLRFDYRNRESIEQVRIFDMTGRMVVDTGTPPSSLDVSDWKDGLYFVLLTRKDGSRIVKKLLKQ